MCLKIIWFIKVLKLTSTMIPSGWTTSRSCSSTAKKSRSMAVPMSAANVWTRSSPARPNSLPSSNNSWAPAPNPAARHSFPTTWMLHTRLPFSTSSSSVSSICSGSSRPTWSCPSWMSRWIYSSTFATMICPANKAWVAYSRRWFKRWQRTISLHQNQVSTLPRIKSTLTI